MENPAAGLKYRKRKKPIRLTPTFEQFKAIVADIRAQPFNREAGESGDFVEFLALAGLGQAEVAAINHSDVDLQAGRVAIYRRKTDVGFVIRFFRRCVHWLRNSANARSTMKGCLRSTKRARRSPMRASD